MVDNVILIPAVRRARVGGTCHEIAQNLLLHHRHSGLTRARAGGDRETESTFAVAKATAQWRLRVLPMDMAV